jgi:hypothetical protein
MLPAQRRHLLLQVYTPRTCSVLARGSKPGNTVTYVGELSILAKRVSLSQRPTECQSSYIVPRVEQHLISG